MNIQTVQTQEDGSFQVTLDNGNVLSVPDDTANRHWGDIQEWVDGGGVKSSYVAPAPDTTPSQAEMVKALWKKERGEPAAFNNLNTKVDF